MVLKRPANNASSPSVKKLSLKNEDPWQFAQGSSIIKLMLKFTRIREEDYWLYPIVLLNIVAVAVSVYASVLLYRGPALVFAVLGIWFTSSKVGNGYSRPRARVHIAITIILGLLLAWLIYVLTN